MLSQKRIWGLYDEQPEMQCGGCLSIFTQPKKYVKHLENFTQECDLFFSRELINKRCWFCDEPFNSVKQAVNHITDKCNSYKRKESEMPGLLFDRFKAKVEDK